jgi:GNAT superfamily N-acetyltransferase
MSTDLEIRHELRCGDLGRIITLHGEVYEPLPGFGLQFEAFVGRTIAEYILDNNANGRFWLVERNGRLVGCTAVVLREDKRGQLRWVVVDPAERGHGLGKQLVSDAIEYCREEGCRSIFLETTDGLPESQTLYESYGFEITSNTDAELWDGKRPLIYMQLDLA